MKYIKSIRQKGAVAAMLASLAVVVAASQVARAQGPYKAGDRVECNTIGSAAPQYAKYWEKGTVMEFRANDQPDGSWYRVKIDSNKVEHYCRVEFIRPATGTVPVAPKPVGQIDNGADKETGAPPVAEFLTCPIEQKPVRNGSRPNSELLKKLIRCAKREKPVDEGDEGAVKVDIASVQIGAPRSWSYRQDQGNGKAGTVVYPVKATYSITTYYRTATEVEEGWVRILNFYVNAFGEWQIGSEEPVKSPKVQRIQK
jgi:hypothetical protein